MYCHRTLHAMMLFAGKPVLKTLYNLGNIKVIGESASKVYEIGAILLEDDSESKIKVIKFNESGNAEAMMKDVYIKWLNKDEHCSWKTLCQCFRECDLDKLAKRIEKHFNRTSHGKFAIIMYTFSCMEYSMRCRSPKAIDPLVWAEQHKHTSVYNLPVPGLVNYQLSDNINVWTYFLEID